MDISTGLIAKGTAGALAASAAVGGGVWAGTNGMFDGLFQSNNESVDKPLSQDGQVNNDTHQSDTDAVTVPGVESESGGAGTGQNASSQGSGLSGNGSPAPLVGDGNNSGGDGTAGTTGSPVSGQGGAGTGDVVGPSEDARDESSPQPKGPNAETQDHAPVSGGGGAKKQEKKLTKWDEALISYLNETGKDDRDIVFTVTTGKENTKENLTTSFPSFEDDTQKRKLMITAAVSTSNANLMKGTDSNDGIKKLKKVNGGGEDGKDWTWECTIVLLKDKKEDVINLENKEKLIGDDGYFNKLAKEGEKELKAKFIENCAKFRNSTKTKEYLGKDTLEDGKISAEKTFEFQKINGGTNWEMKNKKDFEDWFSTTLIQQA